MKEDCPLLTEFDQMTLGNSTQMIKAILPFLDYQTQRILSMIIRLKELMSTLEFYRRNISSLPFPGTQADGFSQNDMFNEIKKYCPAGSLDMIQKMTSFMQMENMMSAMKTMQEQINAAEDSAPMGPESDTQGHSRQNAGSGDFQLIEKMMNPQQKKSYEEFLKVFEDMEL